MAYFNAIQWGARKTSNGYICPNCGRSAENLQKVNCCNTIYCSNCAPRVWNEKGCARCGQRDPDYDDTDW